MLRKQNAPGRRAEGVVCLLGGDTDAYITPPRSVPAPDHARSLPKPRGISSMLDHESAEYIHLSARDRPAVIFYIGDYNPSGVPIDVVVQRSLEARPAGIIRKVLTDEFEVLLPVGAVSAAEKEEGSAPAYFEGPTELTEQTR